MRGPQGYRARLSHRLWSELRRIGPRSGIVGYAQHGLIVRDSIGLVIKLDLVPVSGSARHQAQTQHKGLSGWVRKLAAIIREMRLDGSELRFGLG